MQGKANFKYARLYDAEREVYVTDKVSPNLVVGPETEKRFNENDGVAVTICCITYNHEDLIAEALDSFLMQKTNFKFQVFVGEDHGPDGTADIVRQYAEKYPDIIIPFLREENMGAQRNLIDLCNHANSPYIAFCEGDDYWTDPNKLQKQYDYMQAHEDVRACYTKVEIIAPPDWFLNSWFKKNKAGKLIFPDCEPNYKPIKGFTTNNNCVWTFPAQTASVFYRWNYDVDIPEWYYTGIIGDHPIFLMQIGSGKAFCLPDVTAAYRRTNVGVYMSSNMDEHFLKTRLDHVRWMGGILEWYSQHGENYPKIEFENRIKHESYNLIKTALKVDDYDTILNYFNAYPEAAKIALRAYMAFYADSRLLIDSFTWKGYDLLVHNKKYRLAFKPKVLRALKYDAFMKKPEVKEFLRKRRKAHSLFLYWKNSFIPKKKNSWVITSFRGHGYMDNAKYFYEYIVKNHPEIDIHWLTWDNDVLQALKKRGLPACKFRTREGKKLMTRASIAITDHNRMSDYSNFDGFNARTKVVQLWHGVGFKAMGDGKKVKLVQQEGVRYSDDLLAKPGDGLLTRIKKAFKYFRYAYNRELFEKYFMLVCPGQERVDMIGKCWNIPEESWFMAGHPRNELIYQMEPDHDNPKIMYAPTFRYVAEKEAEIVTSCIASFDMIQQKMEQINGTFTIRLHPHTWRDYNSKLKEILVNYDRILLDEEKDVYTTLGLYSVVITDYSSISMDFAMLNRPTIFHCPDYDWFNETQAGFNLDFKNVIPGPLTETWEDTMDKVMEYCANPQKDAEFRKEKCKYFFDEEANGPDNSERIVAEIKRRLKME